MNSSAASLEDLIRDSGKLYDTLARPAQAVRRSSSLDQAAQFYAALHALGIATELDYERKFYQAALTK